MHDCIDRTIQMAEMPQLANQWRQAGISTGRAPGLLRDDGEEVTVRSGKTYPAAEWHWATRRLIELTFSGFRTTAHGLLRGGHPLIDEEAKTCPRCGGAVHTLRRFTRLGRTVSVVVCRVCRYTEFAPGSR